MLPASPGKDAKEMLKKLKASLNGFTSQPRDNYHGPKGHVLYAGLFFAAVILQVVAVLALLVAGYFVAAPETRYPLLFLLVPLWIIVAALALLLVNFTSLAVYAYHGYRQSLQRERRELWAGRWAGVLLNEEALPVAPLPAEGTEALLDLKEASFGEEAEMLASLSSYYAVEPALLRELNAPGLDTRLRALEALAKLRSASTLMPLLRMLEDPHPVIRLMAARAAARTIAAMPAGERERAALTLAGRLELSDLPLNSLEEVLVLLGEGAEAALARALSGETAAGFLEVAVRVAGRLRLGALSEQVAEFVEGSYPLALRVAALRALGGLGRLPQRAQSAVKKAAEDEHAGVREEAVRAAASLPLGQAEAVLWARLGDSAWEVRRAAAEALLTLGGGGKSALIRATETHPDEATRRVAGQVLLDAGAIAPQHLWQTPEEMA